MIAITTMDKIPEYCYDCPCHDGNNGKCKAANRYSSNDRPNWCPISYAIPIGWLIDRANDPERAPLYRRYAQMLYEEWQKEKEAQDGKV